MPATLEPTAAPGAVANLSPATGLVMDLETMVGRLECELRRGPTLDAYLLAAGIAQIADDHLHTPTHPFGPAARYLVGQDPWALRLAGGTAAVVDAAARTARCRRRSTRVVLQWRGQLDALLDALALAQVDKQATAPSDTWTARLPRLPAQLREAVVRIPTCFAHFDQRPADIVTLAQRFADHWPDRGRRLLVTGVRTSGSYLAPLCAATLRALGYRAVSTVTVRPGHPLLEHERACIRGVASRNGLALLLDDPPVTGTSVRDAAAMLGRAGVNLGAVVLLLATFGAAELPRMLRGYEAVLLASAEWAVEADLRPAAVERALATLGGGQPMVVSAEPVALPYPEPPRGHRRALFRVRGLDKVGEHAERIVLVEGVGLGYLGAHRLASPALLEQFSPSVFGLREGLLYREWLPEVRRLRAPAAGDEDVVAEMLAGYVAQRRDALACRRDLGTRMPDELPAWLVASRILSAAYGRGWPAARVLVTDRATRRLLRVTRPSLVDGNTDLASWFAREGSPAALIKPEVGEDGFSNLTAQCFDAAFDLAGVTARADSPTLPGKLRRAYAEHTGEPVSEERWLLYELVHLWGRERTQPAEAHRLRRARARAVQRYVADAYLSDVTVSPDGPLCALDVDGVLESHALGFPAPTPASALALRALIAHGYRPVLATGRSLDEAAERCRAYGLPGAVAEYGSATFRARDGQTRSLVGEREAAALDALRAALGEIGGVVVDPDYRSVVRASVMRGPERVALPAAVTARALAAGGDPASIRMIAGEAQTDLVGASMNKGTGLRTLAVQLRAEGARPYALAVGDTAADLPFTAVAARASAPGHADRALARAGFRIMRRPYQAGLVQAVQGLIGHVPGRCPRCRMPAPSSDRAIAWALLGAAERGRIGLISHALKLWWLTR